METEILQPGAVEIDLGEFRLIPGPKGDTGERGPRGYGIESAVLNPDYTLTLKFEDGSSYTTPPIRGEDGVGVKDVRLEPGEYGGNNYSDKIVVELTDEKIFEFEIYNRAAEYYDKAEAAKDAAEDAQTGAEAAQSAAEDAESGAGEARAAAKESENRAKDSETAAKEAQAGAEDARDKAAASAGDASASAAEALKSQNAAKESETAAGKSAESAKYYSGKPPIIREGRWQTWDAEAQAYTDTGEPARGNLMYAAFRVDENTGDLYMYTDDEYTGPGFRLAGNDLEVVLHG